MSSEKHARARTAVAGDVACLVELINAAYRVEDFFIDGNRTSVADVRARIDRPHGGFLVIDGDRPGTLVGAVYVEIRGDRGYFAMLAVAPERQGQGLGRALVAAVEHHSRRAGCLALDLEIVNVRPELEPFYTALGFEPFATAPFPEPAKLRREAHVVLMTKALD